MSFECEACGCKNNEVQSGDRMQEKGTIIKCTISPLKTLVDRSSSLIMQLSKYQRLNLKFRQLKEEVTLFKLEHCQKRC